MRIRNIILFLFYGLAIFAGKPDRAFAKVLVEAATCSDYSGLSPGDVLGHCDDGTWAKYSNVNFGSGYDTFKAYITLGVNPAGSRTIEVRLGSTGGELLASVPSVYTGSWSSFTLVSKSLSRSVSGTHDVYLVFKGSFAVCGLDWFGFYPGGSAGNTPPAAMVDLDQTEGYAPFILGAFSDRSADADGHITGYSWSFGDGTVSSEPCPVHVYESDGTYKISLVVTDDEGGTARDSAEVTVHTGTGLAPAVMVTAVDYAEMNGVAKEGDDVGHIENGDWVKYTDVDFGTGKDRIGVYTAKRDPSANSRMTISVMEGTALRQLTEIPIANTVWGYWSYGYTSGKVLNSPTGTQTVYVHFYGSGAGLCGLRSLKLIDADYQDPNVAAAPVISPGTGVYDSAVTVSMRTATDQAEIRYTTDGREPGEGDILYTAPFSVSDPAVVRARAFKTGLSVSPAADVFLGVGDNCRIAGDVWLNGTFDACSDSAVYTFSAVPLTENLDGLISLNMGPAFAYSQTAAAVRFNSQGRIDVRNGNTYTSDTVYPFEVFTEYRFMITVNVLQHRYSVSVAPAGGNETVLAAGYTFRTEQSGVSRLAAWSVYAFAGEMAMFGFKEGTSAAIQDSPAAGLRRENGLGRLFTVSGNPAAHGTGSGIYLLETEQGLKRVLRIK